jgi:hypothetical protein
MFPTITRITMDVHRIRIKALRGNDANLPPLLIVLVRPE